MKCTSCDGSGRKINGATGDVQRCKCNPPIMQFEYIYKPETDMRGQEAIQADFFSFLAHSICNAVYIIDEQTQH